MATLLTLILKTIISPERSTLKWLGVGDSKVDGFSIGSGMKHAKKSGKLSKSRKLKSKKTSKS